MPLPAQPLSLPCTLCPISFSTPGFQAPKSVQLLSQLLWQLSTDMASPEWLDTAARQPFRTQALQLHTGSGNPQRPILLIPSSLACRPTGPGPPQQSRMADAEAEAPAVLAAAEAPPVLERLPLQLAAQEEQAPNFAADEAVRLFEYFTTEFKGFLTHVSRAVEVR